MRATVITPEAIDAARQRTLRWVESAVVGLNLCPFAAPVVQADRLGIEVVPSPAPVPVLRAALKAAGALLDDGNPTTTTLIVAPWAVPDFEDYLDLACDLEQALADAGAEGLLQIATFHPDYHFEGEAEDSLSHWTNRAPHPMLHLIREADITEAAEQHRDIEGIPAANIERLEALGETSLRALWATFEPPSDR